MLAAPSGASANVYIDVNHPSRSLLHTNMTPLRAGESQGDDTILRALEAGSIEKRQLGTGHMLRKQLKGVAAIAPNVTNEFVNNNTPKLPVHLIKSSKSRKPSPEKKSHLLNSSYLKGRKSSLVASRQTVAIVEVYSPEQD